MRTGFVDFLKDQYGRLPPIGKHDLSGKVVVVTGANSGLGLETARHLSQFKPKKLILACRDSGRALDAKESIFNTCNLSADDIPVWHLDLTKYETVKKFVQRLEEEAGRIDYLFCCAGVSTEQLSLTPDGNESSLQVNVLANALLIMLLLPMLEKSATPQTPSRIVVVGSLAHEIIADLPDSLAAEQSTEEKTARQFLVQLNDESKLAAAAKSKSASTKALSMAMRYNLTKLFDLMLVRQIGPRLPQSVVMSCVDPGMCATPLVKGWQYVILAFLVARPAWKGALTIVYPALSVAPEKARGEYFATCRLQTRVSYLVDSEKGRLLEEQVSKAIIAHLRTIDTRVPDIFAE
ncbi:uncharacterized protein L969DRAFT_95977 [Mixia osmundae IAM 14324]|uniref:Ketoreductase (KR) domain-containing protein n=1 Tax=Mixia osmundae (strain CBS 9802 / IAM 14324 / JCM 22182 / KY 12970) TaxID=764103 RepID=G7DWV0_MIXOS|nr:uncharacterized protein L969DRAFT_97522 [Mixia osmundae IAM 14324]XP_014566707.1 uncharacterized protein L969DRAFT_95977 [Mixia osmundae IAM 14324]KEI36176.1 hypothetical protein L969DRAFT_97522 [Mixia osmundae IAM 14324]KEI38144.1 hypothetical protein L969DRAFT_95977 [Mixia osmundae IAM 14324]GAA95047.1 hypothetical protein E5Q_01702 [Mixia osmundae IAM 14324]